MSQCANRGCSNPLPEFGRFSKCVSCLTGMKKIDKMIRQVDSVARLPPMIQSSGEIAFRVAGAPVSQNAAYRRMGGAHGRLFKTARAKEWQDMVRLEGLRARPGHWATHWSPGYIMDLHSVFPTARSDRDGPLKLVQDALQGVLWANDALVMGGTTTKAVDPAAPRIEVRVRCIVPGMMET